jgi:hypothetical protein
LGNHGELIPEVQQLGLVRFLNVGLIPVFPEILVWLNSDELPLSLLHNLVQILSYFQTPAAFVDISVD